MPKTAYVTEVGAHRKGNGCQKQHTSLKLVHTKIKHWPKTPYVTKLVNTNNLTFAENAIRQCTSYVNTPYVNTWVHTDKNVCRKTTTPYGTEVDAYKKRKRFLKISYVIEVGAHRTENVCRKQKHHATLKSVHPKKEQIC